MGTLSMGGRFFKSEELELIEQRRLEALLEITTKHSEEVQGLKSQVEQADGKAVKTANQIKGLDKEIKTLREQNPDRMKKQIKRLQEQKQGNDRREQHHKEQAEAVAAATGRCQAGSGKAQG